jgi:hypothetical protein
MSKNQRIQNNSQRIRIKIMAYDLTHVRFCKSKYCTSELNELQDLNNKLMLFYIELFIKLRFVKL